MQNHNKHRKGLYSLICMIFLMSAFAKAQTNPKVESILKEVQITYETLDAYEVKTQYKLYKGAQGEQVKATYEGVTVVQDENMYARIHNTEFFKIGKHTLKVNLDQKKGIYGELAKSVSVVDMSQFLQAFKEHTFLETKTSYICTLTSHAITPLPYGKVVIHIDKQSKQILKQELYYLVSANFGTFENQKIDTPKLEIVFEPLKEDISSYENKFELSQLISISKDKVQGRNDYAAITISK